MPVKLFDLTTGKLVDPSREQDEHIQPVLTAQMRNGLRKSVIDFIRAVHPGDMGCLELRGLSGGIQQYVTLPLDDNALDTVRDFASRWSHLNLYHGVANRRDASSGTLANCTELHALFIDIDLKDGVPMSVIWRDLLAFPLAPSFIVHTGGGLQVYWLLAEPIDLTTDLGLARANQWVGDLANRLHGDTNATDPARIFRLPDTENHKPAYGKPSPLTTLLVANPDLRYAFDEVVAVLGDRNVVATRPHAGRTFRRVRVRSLLRVATRSGFAMYFVKASRYRRVACNVARDVKEIVMSDKLTVALVNLEKARNAALEAAITDRAYRLCVVLDADGHVQKGIDRARRMLNGEEKPEKPATKK